MPYDNNNIFRKIINSGKNFIYEDKNTVVIEDKYPKYKIHLLILTKENIENCFSTKNSFIMQNLCNTAFLMAQKYNVENNFRLIVNNGKEAGQEIFHLHMHFISSGPKNL